jgi:prephenate dehydrogenase
MRLGILGTGLIGASIGLRSRTRGVHVIGWDTRPDVALRARERDALDEVGEPAEIYSCDTVVLAMPVKAVIDELRGPRIAASRATLILDVASVKTAIMAAGANLRQFVGTHPMAGSERSGPDSADAALFEDCNWAYVPTGASEIDARARAFITEMGARAIAIDAAEHDRTVARTSHVLQLLAWLVSARLGEGDAQLTGPVARELQRIARSDRALWRDIFEANAVNVAAEARALAVALEEAARELSG